MKLSKNNISGDYDIQATHPLQKKLTLNLMIVNCRQRLKILLTHQVTHQHSHQ